MSLRQPPPGPPEQPNQPPDPDDDPTGMRALLSSLPDPGPMPDDLVARITASLAEEQERRPLVHPLAEVRSLHEVTARKRPLWRTAGLAAAAAAVIGIGAGSLLSGTAPGSLGALFGGSSNDASSAAAGSSGPAGSGNGAAGSSADSRAGSGAKAEAAVAVSIHHSARAYTSGSFDAQAEALLASPGDAAAPLSAEAPSIGPIATEVGLRSCLSALTTEAWTTATADLGTFDGQPAAVVVLDTGAGHTAYAVQRSCSTGHPALLMGPVRLP